ncbi:MAG: glycosyltransferase family 4 protein [Gammaproteobacteria bacterium]|nr:glycosyltransferase family 4 protein [Gammaproteobacteria bacterium]
MDQNQTPGQERKQICYVLAGRGDGGLEKHVQELAGQVSQSHRVSVIAHPVFKDRFPPPINFVAVNLAAYRYNPIVLVKLLRTIKQLAPDLIHAHAGKAIGMIALLSRLLDCPLVATVHNEKQQNPGISRFDRAIGVSRRACARMTHPAIISIPNGTTVATQRPPLTPNKPATELRLAAIGRLVPAKGFDLLLDAWRSLPYHLDLVGDGPEEARLKELAQQWALGDRVKFVGHCPDVPKYLLDVDLLIISSRNEGFPYVLVESLLVGTPVISTRIGGAEEILPEPFLAAGKSAAELAVHIRHWVEHYDELAASYPPVIDAARHEYSLATMARRTIEVYDGLLSPTPT